jgi:hypothetical protein
MELGVICIRYRTRPRTRQRLRTKEMPIFTRRRIQNMLDDMRPLLKAQKVNDLIGRLSDKKRPGQMIAVLARDN